MSTETRPLNLGLTNGRLLFVASGSFGARHVPAWIEAIRHWYPGVDVRVLITENALKFVTVTVLKAVSQNPVLGPGWPFDEASTAVHREIADWPDAVVVMPATANTVAKLAAGLADSFPSTVLQNVVVPCVIVPAVSPQIARGKVFARNTSQLRDLGYIVLNTTEGSSASSGELEPGSPASLPVVLHALADAMRSNRYP